MKKIIFALFGVCVVGILGYLVFEWASSGTWSFMKKDVVDSRKVSSHVASGEYNSNPMMECVRCIGDQTWDDKPCCTDAFESSCFSRNGVVRTSDLHPEFTVLMGCFRKASDAGKDCASVRDCLSGVCDLKNAIQIGRCVLVNKDFVSESQSGYPDLENRFYTATYDCSSDFPGVCAEARENRVNPGGETHTFTMQGKTLIEKVEPGPIR